MNQRCCLLFLLLFSLHIVNAQGFLHARDTLIVDGTGKEVILRGMGLGGWMLQEGYMYKVPMLGQQYRIREKITDVVGKERADEFYRRWLAEQTTKTDIDSLAAWGFNSIRLPMHYRLYTLSEEEEPRKGTDTWLPKGFAYTDSLLAWCKSNRIWLILDLHAAPGGQGNDLAISDRDPARPSIWESEGNRRKTIALWVKLATRYRNEPWIGGYDLINEPNWGFEDPAKDTRGTSETKNIPLKKLLVDLTKAIRKVDRNHIIIIEGNGFGNNYRGVLPPWDDNLVLSFHKYGNFNSVESISQFLALRHQHRIPIWLGESGENSNTWYTELIGLAERNHIGWAWWQHKKMRVNQPLEVLVPEGYDQLVAYWAGERRRDSTRSSTADAASAKPAPVKPSPEQAWKVLNAFLENTHILKNRVHRDVIDAMFRQVYDSSTRSFTTWTYRDEMYIPSTWYDLGRQRHAYYDVDSASYHYTPGVNTVGNRGGQFRNDGVDIYKDEKGNYIGDMEAGEWLQYTISVPQSGTYTLTPDLRSPGGDQLRGVLRLSVEGQPTDIESRFSLSGGSHQFRLTVEKGGGNIQFHGLVMVKN